jgi:quinol monooxygenase YgiN
MGCKRFDVLTNPEERRRFVLYESDEGEAAFDDHLVSSHYLRFADVNREPDGRMLHYAPRLLPGDGGER